MAQLIQDYIKNIQQKFNQGGATEHTYRAPLENLLLQLNDKVAVTNEHERITGVGMPDFTIRDKKNSEINIGWIEAKDLHIDLDEKKNKDQLDRYLGAFDNFIYTNNLEFKFYRNGKLVQGVSLGQRIGNTIQRNTSDLLHNNIQKLEDLLKDFLDYQGQTITSSKKLAKVMAGKAKLIAHAINTILEEEGESSLVYLQYKSFKDILIHDMKFEDFADMYAQTIVYGMFAARLHDNTLEDFTRMEAQKLIPKSNPFLRRLFNQIANNDEFDDRLAHIVDDLLKIFVHCDVKTILADFGKTTQRNDPIVHFYEDFLGEYDPAKRKARGVYYTPEPVVQFIVKGVDQILKSEFGLSSGLADTSKIEYEEKTQGFDQRRKDGSKKNKIMTHRVQLLDPATGTGTFLNEVIKFIYNTYFIGQGGAWQGYVENELLPRLFGFEILMASYTMCHLKLGLTLTETGYQDNGKQRLGVYLTNSLEEANEQTQSLFAQQLAQEAEKAHSIKNDKPVMVVLGNPPYAVSSSNKGGWIQNLIADYKKDLNEKSINSLSDDYVKFIRYAQYYVDKNGEGIVAMITNNSYIDGITHRQMRKILLESFDKIYIYNLHGNSKKKEICPDGSKDENVFDIMQGVSIIFAIKKTNSKKLAEVYHYDSWGKREVKNERLRNQDFITTERKQIKAVAPYYFFVPKDFGDKKEYDEGIKISELFVKYGPGIESGKDDLFIGEYDILNKEIGQIYKDISLGQTYNVSKSFDWVEKIRKTSFDKDYFKSYQYKPFDFKSIYYNPSILRRPNITIFNNIINLYLISRRTAENTLDWNQIMVSNLLFDKNLLSAQTYGFPLYIYNSQENLVNQEIRKPNFDMEKINQIAQKLGLEFIQDGSGDKGTTFGPEDVFDYIYAVLHSPTYRDKYKEFLKIDFPRIPLTDKKEIFWKLVEKGKELRLYHLMEHQGIDKRITNYPEGGNDMVEKIKWENGSFHLNQSKEAQQEQAENYGKVFINDSQFFSGVPKIAWEFYIGGYQPAQKRLKDRKGRQLSFEDILHWQKIIVALVETDRLMREIEEVKFI